MERANSEVRIRVETRGRTGLLFCGEISFYGSEAIFAIKIDNNENSDI
jgi:hypothetical protein